MSEQKDQGLGLNGLMGIFFCWYQKNPEWDVRIHQEFQVRRITNLFIGTFAAALFLFGSKYVKKTLSFIKIVFSEKNVVGCFFSRSMFCCWFY